MNKKFFRNLALLLCGTAMAIPALAQETAKASRENYLIVAMDKPRSQKPYSSVFVSTEFSCAETAEILIYEGDIPAIDGQFIQVGCIPLALGVKNSTQKKRVQDCACATKGPVVICKQDQGISIQVLSERANEEANAAYEKLSPEERSLPRSSMKYLLEEKKI